MPLSTAQDAEPKVCIVAVTPEDSSASVGAKGAPAALETLMGCKSGAGRNLTWQPRLRHWQGRSQRLHPASPWASFAG